MKIGKSHNSMGTNTDRNYARKVTWLGVLYWLILNFSFSWALQRHWSAAFPAQMDLLRLIIATSLVVLLCINIPKNKSIVELFLNIILYIVILPIGVVYIYQSGSTLYFFLICVSFLFVERTALRIKGTTRAISIGRTDISKLIIWAAVIFVGLSFVNYLIKHGVPNLAALDFSLTYEIRASYSLTGSEDELYQISTKALIPFLVSVGYKRRNIKAIVLLLIIQFFFFLWLANKTTLFSIAILVLGIVLSKSENRTIFFSWTLILLVGIVSILEGLNYYLESAYSMTVYSAYSLVVRRALFVPGYLKHCYYDFFILHDNPIIGFFGTIVAPIMTAIGMNNPYKEMTFTRVIGNQYAWGSYANTGLFGKELAHFGIFGILAAAIFLLLFLYCVKTAETRNGKEIALCLSLYTIISLADGGAISIIDFSPMLITGLILSFFKLYNENKRYEPDYHQLS